MAKTRIVELHNKSRDGKYLYVKEKGTRGAYYKFDSTVEYVGFERYYRRRYIRRDATARLVKYKRRYEKAEHKIYRSEMQKTMKKARRYPSVNQIIGKGVFESGPAVARGMKKKDIEKMKRQIIGDAVRGKYKKQVTGLMKKGIFRKLSDRMEYSISIRDNEGNVMITMDKFGGSLEDAIAGVNRSIKAGQQLTMNDLKYVLVDSGRVFSEGSVIGGLKQQGFRNTVTFGRIGAIGDVDINAVLRKG